MLFLCDSDAKQSHQTVCSVAASWLSLPEAVTWFLSCLQEISSPVKSLLPISTFWPESFTTGLRRSAWRCWRGSTTPANQVSLREQVSLGPSTSTSDTEQKDETNQIDLSEHFHTFSVLFVSLSVVPSGGGVLLVEAMLFENRRGPVMAQIFSLNMLVQAEGRERPPSEYTRMLTKTGFRNVQVCRTGKSYDAILAVRWAQTGTGTLELFKASRGGFNMSALKQWWSVSVHMILSFMILFFKARTVTNLQDWSCC